jgi:hypothetical protein
VSDYFMGMELPPELPEGAALPEVTPPEGVVFQKTGLDGWTRKYLRHAGLGSDGRRFERNLLVHEAPPGVLELPRSSMGGMERAPRQAPSGGYRNIPLVSDRRSMVASDFNRGQSVPIQMGRAGRDGTSQIQIAQVGPRLGQISPTAPTAPVVSTDPNVPESPSLLTCPGPVEMPDGATLKPDDPITLKHLCDILPYLIESLKAEMGPGGPQTGPVPLVGQQPGGPYATAISPPSGMFGQGGAGGGGGSMAGFPGGGGGGPGPRGLTGPPGIGAAPDFITKTDGDFTAGPGVFIPVPRTQVAFVQGTDGVAIFFLQAVFGCSGTGAQTSQIGLRLTDSNGVQTDFPLTVTLLHTDVADVTVLFQPAPGMWPVTLSAGSYTIEVILRGLSGGEFCGAGGYGFPAVVSANVQVPLALVAFHR